jgi:hypothetical protein
MTEERPVSKYAAKMATRYRYSFETCEHSNTYIDRYAVPNGQSSFIHYTCKRCASCDIILGEPRIDWKRNGK